MELGYGIDRTSKNMQERDIHNKILMREIHNMRFGLDHTFYRLRSLAQRCFNKLKRRASSNPSR